jgi:hypothetical protein
MVFVKKAINLIWQDSKHSIFTYLACIAMQNHFPSQGIVTQVETITANRSVPQKTANLGSIPNIDANDSIIAAFDLRV